MPTYSRSSSKADKRQHDSDRAGTFASRLTCRQLFCERQPRGMVLRQSHISANSTVRYFTGCGGYSQRSVAQQQPGHSSGGQGEHGRHTYIPLDSRIA